MIVRSMLTVALLGLAISAGEPAQAKTKPFVLQPSSAWNIDYADDSCALRRVFRNGDEEVYLELRRFAPGVGLQTTVAAKTLKAHNPPLVKYRFADDDQWRAPGIANAIHLSTGFSGVIFTSTLLSRSDFEAIEDTTDPQAYFERLEASRLEEGAAANVKALMLRGAFPRDVELDFGALDKPIEAMDRCVEELLTHWDIDVEAHESLMRPAVPVNLREIHRMMDYPPKMLAKAMPGLVNVRLDIDPTGRITQCHIQMPLSDPAFEKSTCADLQHALDFDPALDKNGKPIASYWVTRVNFRIR